MGWIPAAVFLLMAGGGRANDSPLPGENVAQGANYAVSVAPNYEPSKDAGDGEQLTDGVYTDAWFWTQPSTVGWQDQNPVIITLDLGSVVPIGGVSLNTAAGASGVTWPQAVQIFTADEEGAFHEIGDLVELSAVHDSPTTTEYAVHSYWTDQLRTHGRYVGLIVWNEPFVFIDEIEVYAGDPDWLDEPLPGPAIADLKAYVSRIGIEAPSDNIALGASYTLDPAPNYGYSSDAGDGEQLTDGFYTDGYFWTQLSTVGWQEKKPVIVTLDLGSVRPIRGISFNTAGGFADVRWPQAIRIFTAGEDGAFHEIADLVALSVEHGSPVTTEYGLHRYWTDRLRTHGRYVGLVIWNEPFTFVDEIEVFVGEPGWLEEPLPGPAIGDLKEHAGRIGIQAGIRTRLLRDIQALRLMAEAAGVPERTRDRVLGELAAVEADLGLAGTAFGDDFRTVLPLNSWHERVLRTQAWLWRAQGLEPLTFWQPNLWDPVPFIGTPDTVGDLAAAAEPAVEVHLMRKEHRAAAFNISNSSDEPVEVAFRLSGLPGGDNPDYVVVHEVVWTDTRTGVPVASALPEVTVAGDRYSVSVPSGMTRQVWLTFHPVDVAPGIYEGDVVVESPAQGRRFPLLMKLYPLEFPEQQSLHLGGWDYTDQLGHHPLVTERNRPALIEHLREHRVDTPWGLPRALPRGTHDAQGVMTAPPDTDHFDAWLKLWPDAAQYYVFAKVGDRFQSWEMEAPQFTTAVQAWVTFWADYMVAQGLRPEQLALLLVDEPHQPRHEEIILAWTRAIREADTGVRVWENPNHRDMSQASEAMIDACHVLCPHQQIFLSGGQAYADYFARKRDQGIALEFYSAWASRLYDPYAGRLMAWSSWRYGATGIHFWSMADTGEESSWQEYLAANTTYAPLFLTEDEVTAGKQLEAVREGVQDYEYLAMLDRAIRKAAAQGMAGAEIEDARQLLETLPAMVCDAQGQETSLLSDVVDRTLADEARMQVLAELTELSALTAVAGPVVVPHDFRLEQNYPNPFNPSTTIAFAVPARGDVKLTVYNLAGQKTLRLVDEVLKAGRHTVSWDGRDAHGRELASGVYIYRLKTGDRSATRKLLMLK